MQKKLVYGLIATILLVTAIVSSVRGSNNPQTSEPVQATPTGEETTPQRVEASGQLKAQAYASLAWKTEGTVGKIKVKVGDQVKAGDILMELQTSSVATNVITAQADLVEAKKSLEDALKSNLLQANAEQELANAREDLKDAQDDYARLKRPRASVELIKQTQDDRKDAQDQVKSITWIYNEFLGYDKMDDSRYAKSELTLNLMNIQEDADDVRSKLNWYTGKPSEINLMQAKAAVDLAQARVADAQREVERLKDFPNAEDVTAAQAKADAAQSTVNLLYILAPFDGEVLAIEQNPGDNVSNGTTALLFANRSQLHVDAHVAEMDISLVNMGDSASVTLDSIPGKTFTGRVTLIEPVGKPRRGLVKFTVRIDLDPVDGESVLLGGTADVTILVGGTLPTVP